MASPRELIEAIEQNAPLPAGAEERFAGYGVMGAPFASGHVLALRRFVSTSIGSGYRAVWHRDPQGNWTFYQDVPARQGCARYFGDALTGVVDAQIDIAWTGEDAFRVTVPDAVEWEVRLSSTRVTAAMNAMSAAMPDALWRNRLVLRMMASIASVALGAGRMSMLGKVPNRQAFLVNPQRMWLAASPVAVVRGEDLGPAGPLLEQARLGDFWIPQRTIFATGRAFFEAFDPARHLDVTSRQPAAR